MKNFVLGIGIVILFGLVLWQGIELFYPSPKYTDFCGEFKTAEIIDTKEVCEDIGGQWQDSRIEKSKNISEGFCDRDFTCRNKFEETNKEYSKYIFFISLIVGLIALIIGYTYLSIEPVGSALMGGGIWAIFWGSVINWRNFTNLIRFILLLLVLILLIWLSIKLNKKNVKKNN